MTSANLAKNRPGLVNIIYVLIFVAAVILFLQSLEVKALLIGYCVRGSLLFYFSYNLHIDQELKEYLGFGYQKSPEVA